MKIYYYPIQFNIISRPFKPNQTPIIERRRKKETELPIEKKSIHSVIVFTGFSYIFRCLQRWYLSFQMSQVFFWFFSCFFLIFSLATFVYTVLINDKVQLPCDIQPPTMDDQIVLVLWYKDDEVRYRYHTWIDRHIMIFGNIFFYFTNLAGTNTYVGCS